MFRRASALTLTAGLLAGPAAAATFDIVFEVAQDPSDSQRALLAEAESFWETRVPGYLPGIEIGPLAIEVGAYEDDGENGTLAFSNWLDATEQSGFILPTAGYIDFDIADLPWLEETGLLFDVAIHEIAHVMGFGSLWTANGLSDPGSGAYRGAAALAAYRAEFDPRAAFVPVELDGGDGTRDAHWDEDWSGPRSDLMTGYLEGPSTFSTTTLASFRDLGYDPVTLAAVPLPAGLWLALGGLGLLGTTRRRRGAP